MATSRTTAEIVELDQRHHVHPYQVFDTYLTDPVLPVAKGAGARLVDTDEELILLDIPDWDFEWQLGYQPVDDIVIDRNDVIRIDCGWNRERAPYEAVGYILWSDGTGDEMCYSSITTAPVG